MKKGILDQCLRIAKDRLPHHPKLGWYMHYAFVVQDGRIVEWSYNISDETHILHAEIAASRKARGVMTIRKPFHIINVRLSRFGELRQSAPCPRCAAFLRKLGCQSVWHTTDEGWEKVTCAA